MADKFEIMCQFLIGKVQHEKIYNNFNKSKWNMCQFLIGKVQLPACSWNEEIFLVGYLCQFLIGKVQQEILNMRSISKKIELIVSIPHR